MFKVRINGDHTHSLDRNAVNGYYTVTIRAGATLVGKAVFDTGREAHRAFTLSPNTFVNRYN